MVVEVEAEDGTCGVGVTIGGEAGCYIVENHFSRFCEGQDPRNIEPRRFQASFSQASEGQRLRIAIPATHLRAQ